LLGRSSKETVNALGVWYAHASGTRQALFDRTLTKRIQPAIAARASVFAAYLVGTSFSGPSRIVAGQPGALTALYGFTGTETDVPPTVGEVMAPRSTWAIEELDYKRYACCGVSGPAIAAASALSEEHELTPDVIEEIRIFGEGTRSPFGAVAWGDHETPQVLAQFCVPYATASAIRNRRFGPAEIAPSRIAEDRDVDALARRTRLCSWDEWEGPRPDGSIVLAVPLKDGRELRTARSGHRRYHSPADDAEIVAKFRDNVRFSGVLDERRAEAFVAAIGRLDGVSDIGRFVREWLARPVHPPEG